MTRRIQRAFSYLVCRFRKKGLHQPIYSTVFVPRDSANYAYAAHLLGAICCVRSGCEQVAQDPASTSALKALTTRHVYHQGHSFSQRCKPQNADYVLPSPSPAASSVSCMDDKQCVDSTDRQFLALATAMAVRFY